MVIVPSKWQGYLAAGSTSDPQEILWRDADDLARLSMESLLIESTLVRRDRSRGSVRLVGAGVHGHSVRVDNLSKLLANFQRLVLASGMSLEGHRSLKGQPPPLVASRTRLRVEAAPAPGSLIIGFVADSPVENEVAPDGQADILGDETTLLDRAIEKSMGLLLAGKEIGADADESDFIDLVEEAGPRVASTLRDLVDSFIEASIEPEVVWLQPRSPRFFVSVATPELIQISKLVSSRSLASEPLELVGVVHTVSDLSPLKIETDDGEKVSVDASQLPHDAIRAINVGDYVRIKADVTVEQAPGGEPTSKYVATTIDQLPQRD